MTTITMRRKKFKLQRPKSTKKTPTDVPSTSAPPPPWIELPRDVTANILHRLGAIEILESARGVCTTWRNVCREPAMWRVIDMKNHGDLLNMPYDLQIMCRHAVDRGQGQLIDINIEYFGTDELLHYISESMRYGFGALDFLNFVISFREPHSDLIFVAFPLSYSQGLSEAVKKFPQLEELHLFLMSSSNLSGSIESIGRSCPMLKSFTFNERAYKYPLVEVYEAKDDEYALAIAKTMPNLRHLRLFGDQMTNEGLQAILDNCPHLESLDIRKCFNIDLTGDLGKRLSRQIKNLRRPSDSTADYEWDAETYDSGSFSDEYYLTDYSDCYSIGDFDDYTDPFSSEYYPDNDSWFFDRLTISDITDSI
ncbi:hypothetical protein RD792_003882 [Penstemon davidsonii]|uniref:F-box domain-containing protein n=1 Tax=Penstemon davidsonii TaxID=160366 RepID=A0ABR0DGQ4_9LAMI|nr:hypothetical protein RD792_003882 [Penstemon davidsonii]